MVVSVCPCCGRPAHRRRRRACGSRRRAERGHVEHDVVDVDPVPHPRAPLEDRQRKGAVPPSHRVPERGRPLPRTGGCHAPHGLGDELAGTAFADPDADPLPPRRPNRRAGGDALPGVEVEARCGEEAERCSTTERRTCIARPVHPAGPNRERRAHRRPGLQPVLERSVRQGRWPTPPRGTRARQGEQVREVGVENAYDVRLLDLDRLMRRRPRPQVKGFGGQATAGLSAGRTSPVSDS